jgi:ribosomal protein S18 acetylase RimI-like enzyme
LEGDDGKYLIRKGRVKDKQDALVCWQHLNVHHRELSKRPGFDLADDADKQFMRFYERTVRSRKRCALVAEDKASGMIVGMCLATLTERHKVLKERLQVYVEELAVHEEYRGKGIGALLMKELESWVREMGVKFIMLHVMPENVGGLHFYEKLEYEEIAKAYRIIMD